MNNSPRRARVLISFGAIGANDFKQRRKVKAHDLEDVRRTSEETMRRLSTHDDDDLPPQATEPAAPVAPVAATEFPPWPPNPQITASVRGASQRGRDAIEASNVEGVDQALQDTTAALRGSEFMNKFSGVPMVASRPSTGLARRRSRRTHEVGRLL